MNFSFASTVAFAPKGSRPTLALLAVFFLSLIVFSQGIDRITAPTEKDEYYLNFRTPLFMMQEDVWLLPSLDGEPRLAKPPMLYWITRASYEIYGPTLSSARSVAILFASLLVLVAGLIGHELTGNRSQAVTASFIALSLAGLQTDGRQLMLDIPVAAFSAWAFFFFLVWLRSGHLKALLGMSILLAAGFLTKGPIVSVVFGGGAVALLFTQDEARTRVRRGWPALAIAGLLTVALASVWFIHVFQSYPDAAGSVMGGEVGKRDFPTFSMAGLAGILMAGLPWTLVAIGLARVLQKNYGITAELRSRILFLFIWLGLTVLPFFFIRTFERYILGSLVPLALLCGQAELFIRERWFILASRAGFGIMIAVALAFIGFAYWFGTASTGLIVLTLVVVLAARSVWWNPGGIRCMAVTAMLLWTILIARVYPGWGVNGIPDHVLEKTAGRNVVLFGGPQPALLSIAQGRPLWRTRKLSNLPASYGENCGEFLAAVPEEDRTTFAKEAEKNGFSMEPADSYEVLVSRVSWIKFAHPDAGWADWEKAFQSRSLDPLKSRIDLYRLVKASCRS